MATQAQKRKAAKEALDKFVDRVSGDSDEDSDEVVGAELVRAAGDCLLGIWDELRRIADKY